MMVDPKEHEVFVIKQGGVYLRGMYAGGKVSRWSSSIWEACAFRSRTLAESVREKHGGEIRKCNTLTGEEWDP